MLCCEQYLLTRTAVDTLLIFLGQNWGTLMIVGLGMEHKAPISTQFVMIGVLLVIRPAVLCKCFAPPGALHHFNVLLLHHCMVWTKFVLPAIRPRPSLSVLHLLTDCEGCVWGSPSVHDDKGKPRFKSLALKWQFPTEFPSHLCSASRGIKIEEAQILLFQVYLQFPDESSLAMGFSVASLF